jgi:hypothetical protein
MTTKISTLAIDLAKGSFQVCAVAADGACVDAPLPTSPRHSRPEKTIALTRSSRCHDPPVRLDEEPRSGWERGSPAGFDSAVGLQALIPRGANPALARASHHRAATREV